MVGAMSARVALLVLLPVAALVAHATAPSSFDARVVDVRDGDSVTVLDSSYRRHKVRVADIDAPEANQPFGAQARQQLAQALHGKRVRVEWYRRDHNDRLLARLWVAPPQLACEEPACPRTVDAGLALLAAGLAWHVQPLTGERTDEDRQRYATAEAEARTRKAGLWSEPDPVPPWDWRRSASTGSVKMSHSVP